MKKLKKLYFKIYNVIKNSFKKIKNYYSYVPNLIRHIIIIVLLVLFIKYKLLFYIFIIGLFITFIYFLLSNKRLINEAQGNGIIYGGRGKGKGLLLNYIIKKDRTKPFVNVPYHNNEVLNDISEYLNSIEPLTIDNFINGITNYIPKVEKFEGRNVYLDDINVYLPNWADSQLKKKYPSLPPMLAINRHLYNAYCIITTQDRERPYKILKELQSDFSIKAVKSYGWGFIWNCLPILNKLVYTKYIYHELPSASDKLPFNGKGVINETVKGGYLTSGQATKEVYKAENGIIRYGRLLQLKKHIKYDTRFFHRVVYGKKSP